MATACFQIWTHDDAFGVKPEKASERMPSQQVNWECCIKPSLPLDQQVDLVQRSAMHQTPASLYSTQHKVCKVLVTDIWPLTC